jgi:hypothetical protein
MDATAMMDGHHPRSEPLMTSNKADTSVSDSQAYRSLVLVEIISNGPYEVPDDLAEIAHDITHGDCSGRIIDTNSVSIDMNSARALLRDHGSDPTFLGASDGDQQCVRPEGWSVGSREPDYGEECVVRLANGAELRCPPYPAPCDYVRVIGPNGVEIGYWNSDEMRDDPEDVLGAVLGAARGG